MIDSLLVDQLLQQRISDTERHRQYEQRQRDLRIERDMAAKERELEGAQRAKSLLRPLTPTESELVRNALYGEGNAQQVVARYESKETGFIDSMQRESMRRLIPGKWLNDEVIHYFYTMLANRDAEMSKESPSRKRCHFFKSFFITKLLDEGVTNTYTYSNVKRWSKNVPGKDIFGLDKVFIPVNIGNAHWACLVIFIQERRIQFFDSLGGDGMYYMDAAMQYLKDEWKSKNPGQELPHLSEWKKVKTTIETPKQQNGFDCGVFTCMFADFLSMGYPLSFTQEHITQCRERIALSILQGCAIR
jgi:sentrin-specific protease 1